MRAQWDIPIADYCFVIEGKQDIVDTGNDNWDLAIADYEKAIELSPNQEIVKKAKDAITLIEEWRAAGN
jgi:hypothetical protein